MRDSPESTSISLGWIEDVAIGGAVLGGGGGGGYEDGVELGRLAVDYGRPKLVPLSTVDDDDLIVTMSGVGAPAAEDKQVKPVDYVHAFRMIREHVEATGREVGAVIASEMGGFNGLSAVIPAAVEDVPMVNAACDGRAHPTVSMGSLGIASTDLTTQSAVGGDPDGPKRVELRVTASLETASKTVRECADTAGGWVAIARNPVTPSRIEEAAAVGVCDQALAIGEVVRTGDDGTSVAERIADLLDGEVFLRGTVESVTLDTGGGFDIGTVQIGEVELTFWNEYMTLETDGERVATFPDLITTLDADTGMPVTTAQLAEGRELILVVAPSDALSLGAGLSDPALYEPVEKAIGRSVVDYVF